MVVKLDNFFKDNQTSGVISSIKRDGVQRAKEA